MCNAGVIMIAERMALSLAFLVPSPRGRKQPQHQQLHQHQRDHSHPFFFYTSSSLLVGHDDTTITDHSTADGRNVHPAGQNSSVVACHGGLGPGSAVLFQAPPARCPMPRFFGHRQRLFGISLVGTLGSLGSGPAALQSRGALR